VEHPSFSLILSAFQAFGLTLHILDDDVVDLAEGAAVFQNFPGLVGMEMDLDEILVAHCQKAVALEVLGEIISDVVLVQVFAFDEELRVITIFQHAFSFV
jgi:hypothetical protein